jgi:hypothetical protein
VQGNGPVAPLRSATAVSLTSNALKGTPKAGTAGDEENQADLDKRRVGVMIFMGALGICLLAGLVGAAVIVVAVLRSGKAKDSSESSPVVERSSESSSQRFSPSSSDSPTSSSSAVASSRQSSASESQSSGRLYELPSALQDKVNQSIDKGKDYVYRAVKGGVMATQHSERPGGALALAALTLLECGVPADDPAIQAAAKQVRDLNARSNSTYGMALAILFLDRLKDDQDEALIRSLALRLMAGQRDNGMWTYDCRLLGNADEKLFFDYLKSVDDNVNVLTGKGLKGSASNVPLLPEPGRSFHLVRVIEKGWGAGASTGSGDNSNTQFGLLGLWVAKRHQVPVQASLTLVEHHFRITQNKDGSWMYQNGKYKASMTCAGLLGLAVGKGIAGKKDDAGADEVLTKGVHFLAGVVGTVPSKDKLIGADSIGDLYFLWSVERVAMIYDLQLIGGTDWYRWAAEILVEKQSDDGHWKDRWGDEIDTCFALLVLKRANVAKDLTTNLKKLINVKDLEKARE